MAGWESMVRMVAGRLFHMSGPTTEKARIPISELRPASFDGSGSSGGGAKLAYIRIGRSKHEKVREVAYDGHQW